MATVTHPDPRVERAFEARCETHIGWAFHQGECESLGITNSYTEDGESHMAVTLERVQYPAHHPLFPLYAYQVSCNGYGDAYSGQKKSLAMRRIVREHLGLKQHEFRWLMVRTGGTGDRFRHAWWVFTEQELDNA